MGNVSRNRCRGRGAGESGVKSAGLGSATSVREGTAVTLSEPLFPQL